MTTEQCITEIKAAGAVPPECLENWQLMQDVIKKRYELMHGDNVQAVAGNIQQDSKRLYRRWKRNRPAFGLEVVNWFCNQ